MKRRYRVNIDGRVLEGDYYTMPDAVFGLMRQDAYSRGTRLNSSGPEHSEVAILVQLVEPPAGFKRAFRACAREIKLPDGGFQICRSLYVDDKTRACERGHKVRSRRKSDNT